VSLLETQAIVVQAEVGIALTRETIQLPCATATTTNVLPSASTAPDFRLSPADAHADSASDSHNPGTLHDPPTRLARHGPAVRARRHCDVQLQQGHGVRSSRQDLRRTFFSFPSLSVTVCILTHFIFTGGHRYGVGALARIALV